MCKKSYKKRKDRKLKEEIELSTGQRIKPNTIHNTKELIREIYAEKGYLNVDGCKVSLSKDKIENNNKLYFINLGGYDPNKFEELHESKFMVGPNKVRIKKRAKESMMIGLDQVHTDDLYDVDDCIEINKVSGLYIKLEKSIIKKD